MTTQMYGSVRCRLTLAASRAMPSRFSSGLSSGGLL